MSGDDFRAVSYSFEDAGRATGYSKDIIARAVKAGDLTPRYPLVNGRQLTKPVIEHDELTRWVAAGRTERA